jgi:hypothetical protein
MNDLQQRIFILTCPKKIKIITQLADLNGTFTEYTTAHTCMCVISLNREVL